MNLDSPSPQPKNPFDCLGLQPRPWIDPAELETAFSSRLAASHPDQADSPQAKALASHAASDLADAYRTLKRISSRLGLLETRHSSPSSTTGPVPEPWATLLIRAGQWAKKCDQWLAEQRGSLTELEKAMAAEEGEALLEEMTILRQEVDTLLQGLHHQLQTLDHAWINRQHRPGDLARLRQEFAFSEKIRAQLESRFLRLAEILT